MNLSPEWVPALRGAGFDAVHWSTVGNPRAVDAEIMSWAREHDYVVFTHDLGLRALLARSREGKPSVFQARTQDVTRPPLLPESWPLCASLNLPYLMALSLFWMSTARASASSP